MQTEVTDSFRKQSTSPPTPTKPTEDTPALLSVGAHTTSRASFNSELLLSSVRPGTQQPKLSGREEERGKGSTEQHQIISVCIFTFLLVLTDLCQGKPWLSLLLSLQITSLTETSVVFTQGIIFCLCVNRETNLIFLGKVNRVFVIVSNHNYNIQGSHKNLLLKTHLYTGRKTSFFQYTGFSPNYHCENAICSSVTVFCVTLMLFLKQK